TPGNVNDRDPVPALTEMMASGVGLADLGYRGAALQTQLWEDSEVLLLTPADANTGQATLQRFVTVIGPWRRKVNCDSLGITAGSPRVASTRPVPAPPPAPAPIAAPLPPPAIPPIIAPTPAPIPIFSASFFLLLRAWTP